MNKRFILMISVLLVLCSLLSAQEISEKKEIAIFALSYYDVSIPGNVLGGVDSQIQNVFVNMGRFKVSGMDKRLSSNDVSAFIDKLKAVKEENMELPEEVLMGKETFTEADFNRLVGAFYVIIPSLNSMTVDRTEIINVLTGSKQQGWKASLQASFSVIDVSAGETVEHVMIDVNSSNTNKNTAIKNAVNAISTELNVKMRKTNTFKLKTAVLAVKGNKIEMELGKNMGIKSCDEYVVLKTRTSKHSGRTYTTEDGLVIVKKVRNDFSEATILKGQPGEGDQLVELAKYGIFASLYGGVQIPALTLSKGDPLSGLVGLSVLLNQFYFARPAFMIEVPLNQYTFAKDQYGQQYVQMQAYLGGEFPLRMRSVEITPRLMPLGLKFYFPLGEKDEGFNNYVAAYNLFASLRVGILFGKNFRLYLEGGPEASISFNTDVVPNQLNVRANLDFSIDF